MIHEILPVGPLLCACSVVGDESTRSAIVVDPGDDIDKILAIVQKHKLKVQQIVITHAHIDHVGGAMKLRAATGAEIFMNQNDYALLESLEAQAAWLGMKSPGKVAIDHSIGAADSLKIGPIVADIFHTPGHTEGSICLYFPTEKKLLAGDTLFAGSVGRTDLPGGSFGKIIASIRDQLLQLPDETIVIPGHGPSTTIGQERRSNPFIV